MNILSALVTILTGLTRGRIASCWPINPFIKVNIVKAAFTESIPIAIAYDITIMSWLDLNHEKNFLDRNPKRITDKP